MDQSKSNNQDNNTTVQIELPKRSFSLEFFVGLFSLIGLVCAAYLAVGLGGLEIGNSNETYVFAEFDNVSGLKYGAAVEIAGVKIGEVTDILLEDPVALVKMKIKNGIKLRDDDIASIRTKGIIGDRFVKISRGASDLYIEENGRMTETESAVDIEDIIGKIVHNLEDGDDNDDDN